MTGHSDERLAPAEIAVDVADQLAACKCRVVFAESCTAGMVSACLAGVPGISDWLCGSFVTYRERSKHDWLGIDQADIERFTAVSETVTRSMARAALQRTLEARVALAVTGHLGPNAPPDLDGVLYTAIALRRIDGPPLMEVEQLRMIAETRAARQIEAAAVCLERLRLFLRRNQTA